MDNILHITECRTREDSLDMVSYSITVLLQIRRLKYAYPDVTQSWYADNAWSLSMFDNLGKYFNLIEHNDPALGYYPESTKIILTGQ